MTNNAKGTLKKWIVEQLPQLSTASLHISFINISALYYFSIVIHLGGKHFPYIYCELRGPNLVRSGHFQVWKRGCCVRSGQFIIEGIDMYVLSMYFISICYRRNGYFSRICSGWPKSHRRNGTRDEHKHLDQIYERQICTYFLKEHLIFLQFF